MTKELERRAGVGQLWLPATSIRSAPSGGRAADHAGAVHGGRHSRGTQLRSGRCPGAHAGLRRPPPGTATTVKSDVAGHGSARRQEPSRLTRDRTIQWEVAIPLASFRVLQRPRRQDEEDKGLSDSRTYRASNSMAPGAWDRPLNGAVMTQHKNRKALIRARMEQTGERYSEAVRRLAEQEAVPAPTGLFPDVPRTDRTARMQGEPTFLFLNRSGDPHIAEIRELMSAWLSRVPAEHVPDLCARLQGKGKEQFESAFWELYLHEAYLCSGYAVTVHPPVAGTGRHPDFLVEGRGTRFYLEAVQACASADETRKGKLLTDVRGLLDEIAPGSYRLDMMTYAIGAQSPSLRKLRRELREWLSTLNQGAGNHAAATAYRAVSHHTWQTPDGWHVQFGAVPVLPGHSARHLVGMHTTAGWSDDAGRITAALESKADRYGALDAPLVIAVLSNSAYGTDDIDFEDALYGALIGRRPSAVLPPPDALLRPGHWLSHGGWRHANAPQVIAVQDLFPWTVAKVRPRLWSTLQPGVPSPAQPGWLARVQVIGPAPQPGPAAPMSSLFGLPDPWPTVPLNLSSRPVSAVL